MSTQRTGWEGADADLFRLLVENVRDYAVFALDAEGRVLTWSAPAEHLLGYRDEEVLGQPAERFYTPEDVAGGVPAQDLRQALERGRVEVDRWYVRKDGSRFWSGGVTTPLRGEDRSLRGFAKVMRDRTDVKRAEDAHTYAQSIVETVREPLVVLDGGLRVRSANRSFYQNFGVSPQETEGRLLYDLGNRQWDIPRLRTLLEEVLPQNKAFNDFEVEHNFPAIGRKVMLLNARTLWGEVNHTELILLAIEDVTARRQAEEERREIETRFTSLVKNIKDHSIFTLDPEGRVTSWNVEAERILGYTEAEVLGQHFSFIFTPEDRQRGLPEWELRTGREQGRAEDERWHLRKGGEPFWALGIVSALHDAEGRLTGFSKILRDMTERKASEDALREKDLRLRAALVAARMGTWHWDIAADRHSVDESLHRLLGLTPEQAIDRLGDLLRVVHPEDREAVAAAFRRSVEQGASLNVEFRVVCPDGSARWLKDQGDVVSGPDGQPRFVAGACIDITDRIKGEESRAREAQVLSGVRDSVIVTDLDGIITYWNEGASRLFGWTAQEMLGRHYADRFPEPARSWIREEIRSRAAGTEWSGEYEDWRKDGSRVWIAARVSRIHDTAGRPFAILGIAHDITQRKAMEEALRRARDELEQRVDERTAELRESQRRALQAERLASIGQTVTTLAHESRNALQRADACLARLEWRLEGRTEELELAHRAQAALKDLERLFDDVRHYAAPIQLDLKPCDVAGLWRDVWAQVVGQRPDRDTRLEEELGISDLVCEADPFRLGQVFTNLFTNALEACPDPVRVVLSCRAITLGEQPAIQITVRDNGPGFTPEQRRHALEPFFTTKATGTGLGLAITRRIVEAHGGSITLGEGAGGAEILVTLPCRHGEVAMR